MTALYAMSAASLSAEFRARRLSPVEVAAAILDRIAHWEPHLNAMYRLDPDGAMAQARASEARWTSGAPLSALDGVPITVKENIASRGVPAPLGSAANRNAPASTVDAPPVTRIREAGCVLLGKTTMPDYGMLSSGMSSLHGITRNPWRLDRNPSGSSSGAGAAAAAGYGPLHLGTDIGGSVRLPATHCGIFALKPSLGRVPIYPPYLGRVVGPMTRTVADAALLMNAIARPDRRDFMSLPPDSTDYAAALEPFDARGIRVGLWLDAGVGLAVHPEVGAAAISAAAALEGAGAVVETMRPVLDEPLFDGVVRFFEIRLYHELAALPSEERARVLSFVVDWCGARAAGFTGRDAIDAYNRVVAMRDAVVRATDAYDFVVSPVSPILPYEADSPAPGANPRDALPHIAFTVPYSMSEQPAASVNWTSSADGLPIGVQIAGRRFDDLGVLKMARLVERLRPAQVSWPEPPAAAR